MNQLAELLRQSLYYVVRLGRQGGVTTATVLAATGFNLFGPGMSLLQRLEHPLSLMASVVGWTVMFNIGLTHFNGVLKRLVKEGHHTEEEFKQTFNLIRVLLGWPPKVDDERHPDVTTPDSKNSSDTNNHNTK